MDWADRELKIFEQKEKEWRYLKKLEDIGFTKEEIIRLYESWAMWKYPNDVMKIEFYKDCLDKYFEKK